MPQMMVKGARGERACDARSGIAGFDCEPCLGSVAGAGVGHPSAMLLRPEQTRQGQRDGAACNAGGHGRQASHALSCTAMRR